MATFLMEFINSKNSLLEKPFPSQAAKFNVHVYKLSLKNPNTCFRCGWQK